MRKNVKMRGNRDVQLCWHTGARGDLRSNRIFAAFILLSLLY